MMPAAVQGGSAGCPVCKPAYVDRMKAINILVRTHRFEQQLGVYMRRQRQLNQDAIDILACIQLADQCQHLLRRHRLRRGNQLAEESQRLAGLDLAAHINF